MPARERVAAHAGWRAHKDGLPGDAFMCGIGATGAPIGIFGSALCRPRNGTAEVEAGGGGKRTPGVEGVVQYFASCNTLGREARGACGKRLFPCLA
jgi:hypothetical protein